MNERVRKSTTQAAMAERPQRVSLRDQSREVLTIKGGKDPNRIYRWVKDVSDRIQRFGLAGWRFEKTDDKSFEVGETTTSTADGEGSLYKKHSKDFDRETGAPIFMYLMSIDKDLYDYDQKQKELDISEAEKNQVDAIKSKEGADYGSIKVEQKIRL